MSRRALLIAVVSSLAFAAIVGAGFAAYDWNLNPGGIFRGPRGTNWSFVFETALSWFVPVLLVSSPLAVAVAWTIQRIRKQRTMD